MLKLIQKVDNYNNRETQRMNQKPINGMIPHCTQCFYHSAYLKKDKENQPFIQYQCDFLRFQTCPSYQNARQTHLVGKEAKFYA